jgi:hypothetical protein
MLTWALAGARKTRRTPPSPQIGTEITNNMAAQDNSIDMNIRFALNDVAYDRIMARLRNGESWVKSFVTVCPHQKAECKCPFYRNVLRNGRIERLVDGEYFVVHKQSDIEHMLRKLDA